MRRRALFAALLLQGCVLRPEVTQVAAEPGCTYRPKCVEPDPGAVS